MASSREVSPGKYQILWRFGGRQFSKTLVKPSRHVARDLARIEEAIHDIERGRLEIPSGVDLKEFLFSGGKLARPEASMPGRALEVTLASTFSAYLAGLTPGSKEVTSLETEAIHRKHLLRILGGSGPLSAVGLAEIQRYADTRTSEGVSRITIGKELTSLLVAWGWTHRRGLAPPPNWKKSDLTLAKGVEKPPFRSWAQIDRAIELERPNKAEVAALWERLWLDQRQTLDCLSHVAGTSRHPFLPPMFAFAAYTGARRSEMLRSRRSDWDLSASKVAIREKKADSSRHFTRRIVQVHPHLGSTMRAWFDRCPDTPWAVSTTDGEPIGPRMSTKYFRGALKGSKWSVLHGWHVFRHSLASNMASSGADPRIIDEVLGHHTEEMSRRYRHLLPARQEEAINSLFATG